MPGRWLQRYRELTHRRIYAIVVSLVDHISDPQKPPPRRQSRRPEKRRASAILRGPRGLHRVAIAGMTAASDIHGGQTGHERFLRAVGYGLRHFAHIAIQVDGFHS